MQALDISVFRKMKIKWSYIARKFYSRSKNKSITKAAFPVFLKQLKETIQDDSTNFVSRFRATGVWSLDKQHVMKRLAWSEY